MRGWEKQINWSSYLLFLIFDLELDIPNCHFLPCTSHPVVQKRTLERACHYFCRVCDFGWVTAVLQYKIGRVVVWSVEMITPLMSSGSVRYWSEDALRGNSVPSYRGLHCMFMWKSVAQSCLTLCDPMDCNPPGFSVHGILQARILESVAIHLSRGSFWPRGWTRVSCIAGRFFTSWATREALEWQRLSG